MKRRFWIWLIIEKKSPNFLTRFYSHLWLLQRYGYPTLKKNCFLNLEPADFQTRQIFDRLFGGDWLSHSFPMHPSSTPLKHEKTLRISDVFRGHRKGALGTNGIISEYFKSKFQLCFYWPIQFLFKENEVMFSKILLFGICLKGQVCSWPYIYIFDNSLYVRSLKTTIWCFLFYVLYFMLRNLIRTSKNNLQWISLTHPCY